MIPMWCYTRRVKYYETDRMGVVHHSNYLRFLEDARMEWTGDNVMSYREMEKMGIVIPCISASGNFRSFLRFDDLFTVEMRLTEYTGVRMGFTYIVKNADTGEVCYDGVTRHCFTSGANMEYRPISIKRKFPEIHEKMLKLLEE
jgi:acyl-CoA thioester hydrolase